MRSRDLESVKREVIALGKGGAREINLVAQDLTAYTCPSSGRNIAALLRELDATGAVDWIRLLYAYPLGINHELLRTMADLPRVCNYLDLPLQHASESVLRAMRRPLGKYAPRKLVEFIRTTAPELTLRTTFIVGFPGETDADIDELAALIGEGHFLNVGIFTFSPEEGTPAAELDRQIPEKTKRERRDHLMEIQQAVVQRRLADFVGTTVDALIEGPHEETDLLLSARAPFQAPEVDGTIMINEIADDAPAPEAGAIVRATISEVAGYDLLARVEGLH